MKKSLTTVAFHGTPEQEAQLLDVIAQNGAKRENLMPILQEAQEIYGYLPIEVQKIIAEKTGTPLAEVFGVVSFYSQFALNPKGSVAIAVCLGTACYVKGSGDLVDLSLIHIYLDRSSRTFAQMQPNFFVKMYEFLKIGGIFR